MSMESQPMLDVTNDLNGLDSKLHSHPNETDRRKLCLKRKHKRQDDAEPAPTVPASSPQILSRKDVSKKTYDVYDFSEEPAPQAARKGYVPPHSPVKQSKKIATSSSASLTEALCKTKTTIPKASLEKMSTSQPLPATANACSVKPIPSNVARDSVLDHADSQLHATNDAIGTGLLESGHLAAVHLATHEANNETDCRGTGLTCPVCHVVFFWDETRLQQHVNDCLDGIGIAQGGSGARDIAGRSDALVEIVPHLSTHAQPGLQDAFAVDTGLYFCHICQKELTTMSAGLRLQHVNRCCDNLEQQLAVPAETTMPLGPCPEVCPLCHQVVVTRAVPEARRSRNFITHLKRCAAANAITPAALVCMLRAPPPRNRKQVTIDGFFAVAAPPSTDSIKSPPGSATLSDDGFSNAHHNAAHPAKRRRKPSKSDRGDDDLQVALALSESLKQPKRSERKPSKAEALATILPDLLLTTGSQSVLRASATIEKIIGRVQLYSSTLLPQPPPMHVLRYTNDRISLEQQEATEGVAPLWGLSLALLPINHTEYLRASVFAETSLCILPDDSMLQLTTTRSVASDFVALLDKPGLSDIQLVCDDAVLHAHSFILRARCSRLTLLESCCFGKHRFVIHNVSASTMRALLRCIYSGELLLSSGEAPMVLAAATALGCDDILSLESGSSFSLATAVNKAIAIEGCDLCRGMQPTIDDDAEILGTSFIHLIPPKQASDRIPKGSTPRLNRSPKSVRAHKGATMTPIASLHKIIPIALDPGDNDRASVASNSSDDGLPQILSGTMRKITSTQHTLAKKENNHSRVSTPRGSAARIAAAFRAPLANHGDSDDFAEGDKGVVTISSGESNHILSQLMDACDQVCKNKLSIPPSATPARCENDEAVDLVSDTGDSLDQLLCNVDEPLLDDPEWAAAARDAVLHYSPSANPDRDPDPAPPPQLPPDSPDVVSPVTRRYRIASQNPVGHAARAVRAFGATCAGDRSPSPARSVSPSSDSQDLPQILSLPTKPVPAMAPINARNKAPSSHTSAQSNRLASHHDSQVLPPAFPCKSISTGAALDKARTIVPLEPQADRVCFALSATGSQRPVAPPSSQSNSVVLPPKRTSSTAGSVCGSVCSQVDEVDLAQFQALSLEELQARMHKFGLRHKGISRRAMVNTLARILKRSRAAQSQASLSQVTQPPRKRVEKGNLQRERLQVEDDDI